MSFIKQELCTAELFGVGAGGRTFQFGLHFTVPLDCDISLRVQLAEQLTAAYIEEHEDVESCRVVGVRAGGHVNVHVQVEIPDGI
jgi:hypothetical protein